MDFKITEYKRCFVVKGIGRVDSASAPDIEKTLMDLLHTNKTLVLDMEDINFVSSAGWWSIIRVQKELKKANKGELVLVGLTENVRSSMELIGILQFFPVYNDLIEAVASI